MLPAGIFAARGVRGSAEQATGWIGKTTMCWTKRTATGGIGGVVLGLLALGSGACSSQTGSSAGGSDGGIDSGDSGGGTGMVSVPGGTLSLGATDQSDNPPRSVTVATFLMDFTGFDVILPGAARRIWITFS